MSTSFGPFTLDAAARRLLEHDRTVHLSPKAFDVLCLLVEARPAVVAKADIHDRIWPGTFVVEANLSVLVAEIRRALGDSPREERFIRTVHRVGYAFAADVTTTADASAPPTADGRGPGDAATAGAGPPTGPGGATRCWLVWNDRHVVLGAGEHVVGRDPACAVWVDGSGVSRRHASIRVDPRHRATVADLGSTNGTFVDGVAVDGDAPLADGSVLQLGSVTLTFRAWSGRPPVTERIRR